MLIASGQHLSICLSVRVQRQSVCGLLEAASHSHLHSDPVITDFRPARCFEGNNTLVGEIWNPVIIIVKKLKVRAFERLRLYLGNLLSACLPYSLFLFNLSISEQAWSRNVAPQNF